MHYYLKQLSREDCVVIVAVHASGEFTCFFKQDSFLQEWTRTCFRFGYFFFNLSDAFSLVSHLKHISATPRRLTILIFPIRTLLNNDKQNNNILESGKEQ